MGDANIKRPCAITKGKGGRMKNKTAYRALLAAAIAPLLASMAFGQVRAEQNGQAIDANNRVGSGGYNQGGSSAPGVTPNQVIYGNVTGGKQFTGPVHERDPQAFTGPIPGSGLDRFIQGSSAAPESYQPSLNMGQALPFYGASRGVAAPIGTVRNGFTGSYLGTDVNPDNIGALTSDYSAGYLDLTQRLGESRPIGSRLDWLGNASGETYFQGPLEAQNHAALFTGSPLYGVRTLSPGQESVTGNEENSLYRPSALFPSGLDRYPNAEVRRLRAEMQGTGLQQNSAQNDERTNGQQNRFGQQNQSGQPYQSGQPNQLGQQDPSRNSDEQDNGNLQARARRSERDLNLADRSRMDAQRQSYAGMLPPQQQSDQYDQLRQRYIKFQRAQMAANPANPGGLEGLPRGTADSARLATSQPGNPLVAKSMLRFQPPEPLLLKSLAAGMRVNGLKAVLESAENLMRHEKFQSAIEKYNTAEQVAPNNGLIQLGRANAELGAGYYQQASADLHKVFLSDQTLLMGQYDLKSMLSAKRLEFVTGELENLARSDSQQEMPAFLLAYIMYNTGKEADAAKYLKDAARRARNKDPLVQLLQAEWNLK
jgi:hypothetical protein